MSHARVVVLTLLALAAFAGNSLLCRAALSRSHIDAASFTTVRLLSGALVLWVLVKLRGGARDGKGSFRSALALFAYAAGFSFAYLHLPAAAGALILFGAVQTTMIAYGLWSVPVIAALGGVAFLDEPLTLRLLAASVAIIGGIGLVALGPRA